MVMIIFLGGMLVKAFFYLSLLSGPKKKVGCCNPKTWFCLMCDFGQHW